MPTQLYETMYILDSTRFSAEADVIKGQLHATIERYGGEIVVSRMWDDRKLLYPIRKQKKATFYIIYYKFESTKQVELESDYRINENILRIMTSKIDPKWADTMLEIAQNDTSMAFAHRGMTDDTAGDNVTPNLGDGFEGEAFAAAGVGRRRERRDD